MKRWNNVPAALLALALFAWSCVEAPTQPELQSELMSLADSPMNALDFDDGIRISEIHYDNAGTDAGEAIEIHGPAGIILSGYSIALYNGLPTQRNVYSTTHLSGTIPNLCSGMGVVVVEYPANGIQNASSVNNTSEPDGIALIGPSGVVEFLSYEGSFSVSSGAAAGHTSTDIGVSESSTTPVDHSLQRTDLTTWSAAPNTFGTCNGIPHDDGEDEDDAPAFLSELHYDNDGPDNGEAFEVSGVAGTDLSGWRVVLYNGGDGRSYATVNLSGVIPTECGAEGSLRFDATIIQNGSPDGLALVDAAGVLVEFLSYEGTFLAQNGTAMGRTSIDIGVAQAGTTPNGLTLQRDGLGGAWYGPAEATWGCEEEEADVPAVFLSEIRADQPSGSTEEYFEVGGLPGTSLDGLTLIVIGDGSVDKGGVIEEVTPLSGHVLSAAGAFVVAESTFKLGTADLITSLNFENDDNPTFMLVRGFTGSDGQDLDTNNDGTLDATPWSSVADCVSLVEYLGKMPIYCDARLGMNVSFTPGHVTRNDGGWFSDTFTPRPGDDTPGSLEFDPATAVAGVIAPWGVGAPGVPSVVTVSASFVRLPVGFNRALFVTVVDDFRDRVESATVTFTSSNSAVVTSNEFGNLTAHGVGEARLTVKVVGAEHVTAELDVDVIADVPSGVAYQDHLEFGEPTDADPSDDHLIVRDEMALSYSASRGGANWVSWNLDASHIGSTARCECYTPEPLRPASAHAIVNFDYTGSGYSRGHVTQSFPRTVTLPDNAATYYTSNILPMSAANNSGPWGSFENYTVERAQAGAEIWIVAGGQYASDAPTLKGEGFVAIPSWTWKVAIFLDRDQTLADVDSFDDFEVIAIRTPNRLETGVDGSIAGISNDWREYELEVDQLEALIGYDLLDRLPQSIEVLVESGFEDLLGVYASVAATLRNEVANALSQRLEQAMRQLEAGRPDNAINRLETFINQVNVFERNGKLDAVTAAALRAEAMRVLGILNG